MKKSLVSLSVTALIGGLALAGGAANAATSIAGTGPVPATNNVSTATVGTATATTGTALRFNEGGVGHINVVPYFSTQNGNQTLLSITNTDANNGKLVKVRFRSAFNSDDIFDFTLFLSPSDVWTANISRGTNGVSTLVTNDKSCTLPASVNADFVLARVAPTGLTGDTLNGLTREGYIEVLNTADIPNVAPTALYTAIKHVNGVAPCTAAPLNALLNPALVSEADLRGVGLDTPSGGLYTNAVLINTANAFLSWTTESTAIQAVDGTRLPARGRMVFAPQIADPVGIATANLLTSDPLLTNTGTKPGGGSPAVNPPINAAEFDFPDLSTPYVGATNPPPAAPATGSAVDQANRLSASMAVTNVQNDFTTLSDIGGKTDFTFSMPTRRYGVAVDYSAAQADKVVSQPGNLFFSGTVAPVNVTAQGNIACVNPQAAFGQGVIVYNREEGNVTGSGAVISPGTPGQALTFCGEASVLTVRNPAGPGVLSAGVAVKDLSTTFAEGWANIATTGRTLAGPNPLAALGFTVPAGQLNVGLPILGSAYTSARGAVTQGLATNFGWTFRHKTVPAGY